MTSNRTSFKPGQSGNPAGRAAGSRNKASLTVDTLLADDAKAITAKAIEMAKAGDPTALRLCLDRIAPVRRDRPLRFALPAIETTDDLTKATASLLAAVAEGDLTPSEAAEIGKLVDAHIRAVEATELAGRLDRLEAAAAKTR